MAILANFIGIDRHADLNIRDLIGARRDAVALWALFCDTIPNIQAKLIVDTEATVPNIRQALEETLGAAGPEDTVILSFSGHGTHHHHLVAHDTLLSDLDNTTIEMRELAEYFKRSQARAILFILDCCFSGGAPARVLEDSPTLRDLGDSLNELAGKGRILIAASGADEPALESNRERHGLLTKAIIDALQTAQGTISLTTAMDQVMMRVRIEADRLGFSQNPVMLGFIEGGLALPVLKPGKLFYAEFPEVHGVRVSSKIKDLALFNLPTEVLAAWDNQFRNGLNNLQLQAVNDFRILDGASLLVVAPTSSGKTFIGEMAAMRAIIEGRKAVFLFPYRALVNEKHDQFLSLYGQHLDIRVIRCSGDYLDQIDPFIRGKYDLALLTFEMFLNLVVSNPSTLNQIGLIVVDEAQFITDPNRGIVVELLLTYLLAARERQISPQIIALSAVIGGVNDFDTWLGCGQFVTHERPVPLIEGVMDRNGIFQFLDTKGDVQTTQLLPPGAIHQRKNKPGAQDMIVPLLQKLINDNKNEKVIVFRNQRGTAQGAAKYLADELGLSAATEIIEALPDKDLSSTSLALRSCLAGGTAFHNTNLLREEKALIEQAFRDPNSKVRVLGATTTLAAGINTPASTVILAEQEFVGEDGRPFTVAEYKNMAGRAGRLGFNEEGKALILASNSHEREDLFRRYVVGKLEEFRSSFDPLKIETWLIRLLAQVKYVPRQDVVRLLANTYGGYLANKENPKWRGEIENYLEELLEKMISLGLVEQEGEEVQLTLLGSVCGRSALSLASAMRLVELLKKINPQNLTAEHLMALVQMLPDLDDVYTPIMKRGTRETIRQQEAGNRYGQNILSTLQRYVGGDTFSYYARCKRAAILWDWINGMPTEKIEQQYSTTPFEGRIGYGDVRKFADITRFHLRSAYQIADIVLFGSGPDEKSIEALLKQLEVGIPVNALDLLSLPILLSRGEYLALYHAGVRTSQEFWLQSKDAIKDLLGSTRTDQLELLRPEPAPQSQDG